MQTDKKWYKHKKKWEYTYLNGQISTVWTVCACAITAPSTVTTTRMHVGES